MNIDLKVLSKHKNALLLAEIGAWLHMFSKLHEDFLKGTDPNFDINISPDLKLNYPLLDSLLTETWTGKIWNTLELPELNAIQLSIFDLINKHRKPGDYGLERLMWDAHGRGSGIEKGMLERFAPKQEKTVYLSTAFGFEENPINSDDISSKRKTLYDNLQLLLNELKQTNAQPSNGWLNFRLSFISMLSQLFPQTVADTLSTTV